MSTLIIERQAILQNLREVKKCAQGAALIGDLSGDAYGLGLLEVAALLADEGLHRFIISTSREAERLRDAGFTEQQLMTLRAPADRGELELLVDMGVTCAVGAWETALVLNAVAASYGTVCDVQILVDSGLGRYGFKPGETDKILAVFRDLPHLRVVGMVSEFSDPAGKARSLKQELERFSAVVEQVRAAGFKPGLVHMADGMTMCRFDWCRMDGVHLGRELGASLGQRRGENFRRAAYVEASVGQVDWFAKGQTVSGKKLSRARRVAVLPVGSLHGFGLLPWPGSGAAEAPLVTIGEHRVPLIGQVGPLDCTVDVTEIECRVGDVAVLEMDALCAKGLRRAYR